MNIHEKAAIGFERAGDSYEKGRPEYPSDAVSYLIDELALIPRSRVADVGAGTGKFTRLLAQSGAHIVAVEPVAGMRRKFTNVSPEIEVVDGTAERLPFGDQSLDAVVVAQAFHWFNAPAAVREIHRVLKPGSGVAMIWNARDEKVPWVHELTKLIDVHESGAPRYRDMKWRPAFDEPALFTPLVYKQFSYDQNGDVEMVVNRVDSISFISALPSEKREKVLEDVRKLVRESAGSAVTLPYRTDVFTCTRV